MTYRPAQRIFGPAECCTTILAHESESIPDQLLQQCRGLGVQLIQRLFEFHRNTAHGGNLTTAAPVMRPLLVKIEYCRRGRRDIDRNRFRIEAVVNAGGRILATKQTIHCPTCGSTPVKGTLFRALLQIADHPTAHKCARCGCSISLSLGFEFGLNAADKESTIEHVFRPRDLEEWQAQDGSRFSSIRSW